MAPLPPDGWYPAAAEGALVVPVASVPVQTNRVYLQQSKCRGIKLCHTGIPSDRDTMAIKTRREYLHVALETVSLLSTVLKTV